MGSHQERRAIHFLSLRKSTAIKQAGCNLQGFPLREQCDPCLFTKYKTRHYEQENNTAANDLHENRVAQENSTEPKDTKAMNEIVQGCW
jgi:hypothetical protein